MRRAGERFIIYPTIGQIGQMGPRAEAGPGSALRALDQPDNGEEDNRAYNCCYDRADQSACADPQ